MLKKVTEKISGKYQKLIATNGDANSIVAVSKPTAMAFVARAGRRFTSRVIISMIDEKTIKIFAEKTPLCEDLAKAGIKT